LAKNLKLNIKNTQIAQGINLSGIKGKLKKKIEVREEFAVPKEPAVEKEEKKEEAPRIKARSRSAFADGNIPQAETLHPELFPELAQEAKPAEEVETPAEEISAGSAQKAKTEFLPELKELKEAQEKTLSPEALRAKLFKETEEPPAQSAIVEPLPKPAHPDIPKAPPSATAPRFKPPAPPAPGMHREKLGPTGRHIKDLIPPRPQQRRPEAPHYRRDMRPPRPVAAAPLSPAKEEDREKFKQKAKQESGPVGEEKKSTKAPSKFREFRDLKPAKRSESVRQFDGRDRQGLRADEDEQWRSKKRSKASARMLQEEAAPVRPNSLKIRIPITIKELAEKMKLKASQLIGKLFLQGVVVTLNDQLTDETTIQLLGQEFGCEISIDTSEEERIRITDKSIREEIKESDPSQLTLRPPVAAFMGHVDHGKTSLIDSIRSSNRVAGEAGAITQHIGAFRCHTPVGDITILDTPGHEAFSAMRARGADVTDIVVLVVAGDEGIRQQTVEAIQHAKAAKVTIVVAINKCDKPNFDAENVYRQLSEHELLPEAWGGQTITVNCSAVTKQGVKELLEMLALQAEVLELKADASARARGTVIESEMHKGMGAVATVLIQNGTLRLGDALVFGQHFGRVKTMLDENGKALEAAGPSTPISITGLSGLPEAGQEFIVVKNEKEAREISEARAQGLRQSTLLMKKKISMDNLLQQTEGGKKVLNLVLRADVQGSLEALKTGLLKIESQKAEPNIIFTGVGEINESDAQLAAASKAVIVGFHTQIEGHADSLVKELGVEVRLHDIIYHAIDDVKALMAGLLDKIPQELEKGKALVKATFKSSHHGIIAGCQVTEGSISRGNMIRLLRSGDVVWRGNISSLKRVKDDVREVQKGLECGIILANFNEVKEGDILEAYEITYLTQEL
jgi:translation initiation factor IF-2